MASYSAMSQMPPQLRCMPILIAIPQPSNPNASWYGSGVILRNSEKSFLVTAKHVMVNMSHPDFPLLNTNATLSAVGMNMQTASMKMDLQWLKDNDCIKSDPIHDVIAIRIGTIANETSTNFYAALLPGVSGMSNFQQMSIWNTSTQCQPSNAVKEGDDTLVLGFPTDLHAVVQANNQVDFSQPLIRKGIISQKHSKTGRLIVDTGVFGGNSGGPLVVKCPTNFFVGGQPVLEVHNIAGIMVEFVPAASRIYASLGVTNSILAYSGYSVAEPIDVALDLIKQFK